MKLSVPVLAQAVLGAIAMALLAVLAFEHLLDAQTAGAGIVAVLLAMMPGISSGHAIDVKTLIAELAPAFTHLPRVSSVTVDRTTTVTKSVAPPADNETEVKSP